MCEKTFLHSHEYRDQKMGGGKCAKQFFQKHKNSARIKCCEKIRRKKSEKQRFYIHTNIVTKKWGEIGANNFSRNTRMFRAKMLGKKSSQKSEKKRFLYSHEYREQKMGGTNVRNNFSRNTQMVQANMLEKNRRKMLRKKVF